MIKYLKILTGALLMLLVFSAAQAQNKKVEMADAMRAEGKIYVVVGIIVIILAGLVGYLAVLDQKVKKLQGLLNQKKSQTK